MLRNCEQYKKVYIDEDRPYHLRQQEQNMRTVINTLGKDKLQFKGNKVIRKQNNTSWVKMWVLEMKFI